ncbi:MAG: S8/S53 family peptidase [Acetobacteraceae bacterium]|nr:S8/S53 family peptidase [Acetobacteraceae bacterium]
MASKKYVKVAGSERKPMQGATKTGAADPNQAMQVTLVLRPRSTSQSAAALADVIARGQRISRQEYAAQYGADPADVQKVAAFASEFGLTMANVNLPARTVQLSGKCAAFSKAFQVELSTYEHPSGSYRGRTGAVNVPQELGAIIVSVHGLDNRPQAKPHFRLASSQAAAAAAVSYTAPQVAEAYSYPTNVNGSGETIGIIELGGGYNQSDLDTYFQNLNISPEPTVIAVSVDGAQNQPTGDTSGPDTEVGLDIEVAGAIAPGATIAVYFAPNTDAGFLDAINQAVTDTVNNPSVLSISWGGPESTWTAQSLQSYNSALQSAAAVGVSVCVAAGDNGSSDGVSDGLDHVDFPASSPYSLACGGTTLELSGTSIESEVVWNDLSSGEGATGGGVSGTFPIPTWQANAGVPPGTNPSGYAGRGVPDVAGDADPNTGYNVQVDGSSFPVGGTSAVAPLWAGLIALMNQSLGKPVGYLNPTLYQSVEENEGAFNDITSGNNGDFSAGPGWDACSGWGSPEGTNLLQALSGTSTGSGPAPPPTTTPIPTPTPTPPSKHKHKHKHRPTRRKHGRK